MKHVLVHILAKQKAKTLPFYLDTLSRWDYPKRDITLYARTNNNTDATADILSRWLDSNGSLYSQVIFDESDESEQVQRFGVHEWNAERFSVLGRLRQRGIKIADAVGADFYFVSDVDNYLLPHTLSRLVALDVPVVGPLLRCADADDHAYANFHNVADANGYFQSNPAYHAILHRSWPGIHAVDVIHCTYLVRRDAFPHVTYDDGSRRYEYVIFSHALRKAGIPQLLDTREVYGCLSLDEQVEACRLTMSKLEAPCRGLRGVDHGR